MNEPVFDKLLINLMPEAIGIADIDGRIHFVNDRFTSLLDTPKTKFLTWRNGFRWPTPMKITGRIIQEMESCH